MANLIWCLTVSTHIIYSRYKKGHLEHNEFQVFLITNKEEPG